MATDNDRNPDDSRPPQQGPAAGDEVQGRQEPPPVVSGNRPPLLPNRPANDQLNRGVPPAGRSSPAPAGNGLSPSRRTGEARPASAAGPSTSRPASASPASGTPGPAQTPLGALSPDDVVNPTPLPLTPGPHRRELGISPVRLTPRSNPSSPVEQHGATPGASPGTPGNGTQDPLVLWGTTVNMDDAEQRLRDFINDFRLSEAVNDKQRDATREEEAGQQQTSGVAEAQQPPTQGNSPSQLENGGRESSGSVPHYIDLLQHLADTGESVMNIDMSHLHRFDSGLYRKMKTYPNELITVFDAVVTSIFKEKFPEEAAAIEENKRKSIQVRTYNLLANHVQSMRELNPGDISNMVAVRGMVIRASSVIPDIQVAMYSCSKCRALTSVKISYGRIDEPRKCNACNTRDSFTLIHSRSTFSDKQMVRLQEAPESIPKGETPATFTLVMYDSLVDAVKPGDRVEVTGILRATPVRVNPKLRVVRSVFRTYIDCVHVRTLNNNQSRMTTRTDTLQEKNAAGQPTTAMDGMTPGMDAYTEEQRAARKEFFETLSCDPRLYERLTSSLAPSIFGMDDEKKGVLLQLFGGASKTGVGQANEDVTSDGSARFRSSINILLVGDPGTSKSQLLHSAHRLAPRGVYTSGRGSSAVGLTAYVTRDPDSDDYVLESGALVLSDRGICCIDEFDKMSEFARSVLHEAMEQQTVSIAKAGIIATLNARTAVLAAANPVNSRYDTSKSVVDNIDLPPTLLSRFDLIYLVLDAPNAEADRKLAQHIVSLFFKNYDDPSTSERNSQSGEPNPADEGGLIPDETVPEAPTYGAGEMLDAKTLTEYIAYARETVDPKLSESAAEALISGYVDMRSGGRGTGNITATPRQLESLIRLAEAHARMQLKEEVDDADVNEAMRLVKSALHMAAYDPNTGKIDMNLFAAGESRRNDTKNEFLGQAILGKLREQADGKMQTARLLSKLRETSDEPITAGDLREALRRLQDSEKIVMTSSGTGVQLV